MNAKKLLSTLMSAAMAVTMLAGCFGGGGSNYSRQAADAANAAQSTVVFSTDATLAKSLQDALADGLTQLDEIDDAMEADENLKPLLTSGWDLDIFAAQGEDAEAAAKTIAEQYIVSAVIGKKAEGKIAMVLHDGNGYYYVAVLTYGSGGSGSGGGAGGGSGSGDDGNRPGPGDDDDEENGVYDVDARALDGNGTVEADKPTVKAGETVTITVTPKDGYKIDKIDYKGGTFNYVRTESGSLVYTMSNVTGDVKFYVTFFEAAPDASTVTFTVTGEGTVTNTANNSEIENGDTLEMVPADKMTFKVNPDQNYEAVVTNEGCTVVDNKDGTYTLSNVTDGATVTVSFKEITYEIEVVSSGYANIVAAPSTVPAGGKTEVTIKNVDAGWKVKEVIAEMSDGTTRTLTYDAESGRYILDNIQADAIIRAEFEISEHTITVNVINKDYGTIDGETIASSTYTENVIDGENFSLVVKPNDKGELTYVKVDGVEITGTDTYTIPNVTKDHKVEIRFDPKTYTVSLTAGEGGSINPSGNETVGAGNPVEFTVTPNPGYEIDKVTLTMDGEIIDLTDKVGANGYCLTGAITADAEIKATFKRLTYEVNVTVENGKDHGKVSGAPATVEYNGRATVTITPDKTYKIDGLIVNDEKVTVEAGKAYSNTFTNITEDINIEVSFVKCDLDHIEVSGEYKDKYTEGEDFNPDGMTVTAVYEDGYTENVTDKCNFDPSQNLQVKDNKVTVSYTEDGVTKTTEVSITVTAASYTVKVVYDKDLGSSSNAPTTMKPSEAKSFTVVPNPGYKVSKAEATNATVKTNGNNVTVSDVTGNVTITVYFEAIKYNVTVTCVNAGESCSVSPNSGSVTVENDFEFTVSGKGYTYEVKVTSNNARVTNNNGTYTVSNPTGENTEITVTVTFTKKPVTVEKIEITNASSNEFERYYWCWEDFNPNGLKIKVTYSDDTSKEFTVSERGKDRIDPDDISWKHANNKKNEFKNSVEAWKGWRKYKGWYEVPLTITYQKQDTTLTVYVRCSIYGDGKCENSSIWSGYGLDIYSTQSTKAHEQK